MEAVILFTMFCGFVAGSIISGLLLGVDLIVGMANFNPVKALGVILFCTMMGPVIGIIIFGIGYLKDTRNAK